MSAPETEADKLPDDAPSIVAQKALMKAIWHCIVDASSMNVVMSGGEVNKATRNLRAAIEAEARQSALTEAIRRVEAAHSDDAPGRMTYRKAKIQALAILRDLADA